MALIKIDGFDLYSYTRVAPGEGLDISDSDFIEPHFGDSSVGFGDPLISVKKHNRELVIPVHMRAVGKDALHALVTDLNRRLAVANVLEWKDDGATKSTYMDIEFGRFEPEFNKRRQDAGMMSGIVRLFVHPYAKSTAPGSYSNVATVIASFGFVACVAIPTYVGDGPLQTKLVVRTGTGAFNGGDSRIVGFTTIPSGYIVDWSSASITPLASAALVATYLEGRNNLRIPFGRVTLPASVYNGNNRAFLVTKTDTVDSGFGIVDSVGNFRFGSIASCYITSYWGTVDLGAFNVNPLVSPTYNLDFALYDSRRLDTFAQPFDNKISATQQYQVARILIAPEEKTSIIIDDNRKLLSEWAYTSNLNLTSGAITFDNLGNSVGSVASYPVLVGNAMASAPLIYSFGLTGSSATLAAGNFVSMPTCIDLSADVLFTWGRVASKAVVVGRYNQSIVAKVHMSTGSTAVLSLLADDDGLTGGTPVTLASTSFSLASRAAWGGQLRFCQRGNSLRADVTLRSGVLAISRGAVTATYPLASGFLQAAQGGFIGVNNFANISKFSFYANPSVISDGQTSNLSDNYTVESSVRTAYRNNSNIVNLQRGPFLEPLPISGQNDALVAFVLPGDLTSTPNDIFTAILSYNETFTYSS